MVGNPEISARANRRMPQYLAALGDLIFDRESEHKCHGCPD